MATAITIWAKWKRVFGVHALLALTLTTSLLSRTSGKQTTINYEPSRKFNAILVVARVDGKPAVLVVDTGSDRTIVSPRLVASRELSERFQVSFPAAHRSAVSAWGKATIQLGSEIWHDHQVVVQDEGQLRRIFDQQVDGILGQDILGLFRRVTIDSETHTLTLQE
jgi:hypothetical protein